MGFPEVCISIVQKKIQFQSQRSIWYFQSLCNLQTAKSGDKKAMEKTKEQTEKFLLKA